MHYIKITRFSELLSAARLLAAAVVVSLAWPAAASASTSVPFTFVDNRMMIQCRINGAGPFTVVFDTGSPDVTLDSRTAATLGLHVVANGEVSGAGNAAARAGSAKIASLGVGQLSFTNMPVTVLNLAEIRTKLGFPRLDGIVGYSVFRHFAVDVDVDGGTIAFFTVAPDAPGSATKTPFTLDGHLPVVRAQIDGIATSVFLDTGDRSSLTLSTPFAKAHQFYSRYTMQHDIVTGYGIGGPVYADVLTMPSVDVLGNKLQAVVTRASRQTGGVFANTGHGGSVGEGVLRRFNIIYDYPHSQIVAWPSKYYSIADRFNPPPGT